jgi:hypothetical protein
MFCAGAVFAQDAAAVMRAAKDRIQWDTKSSRSRMVISARNGSTTERVIDQYAKDGANGYARSVIVFQSPATVRGTRFLTMDNASGKSDQWIFLPGIGKVRRIASSEGGGNFMGTVPLSITARVAIEPVLQWYVIPAQVVKTVREGLLATGRAKTWGLMHGHRQDRFMFPVICTALRRYLRL